MPTNADPAETVVVCRPDQMRQAAQVLSCFPAGALPALFVLEPPPCSEAEYRQMHESYRVMRNLRDEALGSRKARLNVLRPGKAQDWSNEEIDRRTEMLTPFRRWVKRTRLFSGLLKELPLRRAVLLFAATEQDMSMFDPQPVGRLRDERTPLLPDGVEWVNLEPDGTGADFTWQAWKIIRGEEAIPEANVITAASDSISVLTGLYDALRTGVPLVIADGSGASTPVPRDDQAAEAVLLEAADDAAKLVAVQYAVRQGARLCVCAEPDLTAIETCRQRVQDWQEGKLGSASSADDLLRALEAAVSVEISDQVIEQVGNLPLTAFTRGVPYHFVHKGLADWSRKPMGLMTGDPWMLASIELHRRATETGPHFNIVFDPGYFNPRETDGVLGELQSELSFPLVLREAAASNTALIALSGAPVDLIYFNTHGSANAMQFQDMQTPGYKLLQRITLRRHPIVFNNACLSWTGVGRDFIEAGASSYIGTLWSVDAEQAATYAIAVVGRMVHGANAIAACMHDTGADAVTEKAYVFVGPVSACLRKYDASTASEKENKYAVASALLNFAVSVATSGPPPDSILTWPTIKCLLDNAQNLCDEIDTRWPEPDLARLNLLSDQLALGSKLRFSQELGDFYGKLAMRGLKMLDSVPGTTPEELKAKARYRQLCARIAHQVGQVEPAINLLRMSADELEKNGLGAGSEYLELSDLYGEVGKYDFALESALRAREAFEKAQGQPEERTEAVRGAMLACGRLAQLWRRANKLEEAAAAAQDGYSAAEATDNIKEQASFRMDQSRILILQKKIKEAVASAEEAVQKALWSRDDDLKVGALGTMTLALRFAGDLKKARETAIEGRDLALERDIPIQVVDFQFDLCDLDFRSGDFASAFNHLREGADCLAQAGDIEKINRALSCAEELLAKLDSWDALSSTLVLATAVLPAMPRSDRSRVCTFVVQKILSRIKAKGWQKSRDGLWKVRGDLSDAIAVREPVPEQTRFILDLLEACHAASRDKFDRALPLFQRLDELSAGGFQLVDFLSVGLAGQSADAVKPRA